MTGKLVQQLNRGTQGAGYQHHLGRKRIQRRVYTTTLTVNGARATERLLVD